MKGKTNNPNGRPKGSPNKGTPELRQWITDFIEGNKETLQSDFDSLEPKDRIVLFEKLLKYALPTLQATSLEMDYSNLSNEQIDEIVNRLINNDAA